MHATTFGPRAMVPCACCCCYCLLLQVVSNSTKPDLRDIHSIPAGKVDAAAAAAIQVPDTYPHFTPFVENKRQVRQQVKWSPSKHTAPVGTHQEVGWGGPQTSNVMRRSLEFRACTHPSRHLTLPYCCCNCCCVLLHIVR